MSQPKKSIMLVDDDEAYTKLMVEMLGLNLDCQVHAFNRPLEALEALPRVDPCVVVTDYNMPDLNGLDFIRQATPLVPRAHFLLITGHDLSSHKDEMARLGALKGLLPKPFGSRTLAEEILRVWPGASAATG